MDQIETEPKTDKQVPKMPNGALQNGTSSPDSGHPSSRNFSVTSGLSDGSLSTEDSAAPEATLRSAAVTQLSQSSVKPGVEGDGLTKEMYSQEKAKVKDKEEEEEEEKAPNVTKTAEHTEGADDNMVQPLEEWQVMSNEGAHFQPNTLDNSEELEATEKEESKFEDKGLDTNIKGITSAETGGGLSDEDVVKPSAADTESKAEPVERSPKKAEVRIEETSKLEEKNVEKMKEKEESRMSNPQEALFTEEKEKISKAPVAPEVEKNLLFSAADSRVSRAREAYCTSQKEDAQVMTESDESPSAIEMEEIPKAKVSMVPWSRKGCCEPSSSSEDSAPRVEFRQEGEQEKPSPEGTESILSEEPEMESLYPHFDSLAGAGDTKNEATSEESAGSTFSVSSISPVSL